MSLSLVGRYHDEHAVRPSVVDGPIFAVFPTGKATSRFWCVLCSQMHSHGSPSGIEHRVAHCGDNGFSGYFIRPADAKYKHAKTETIKAAGRSDYKNWRTRPPEWDEVKNCIDSCPHCDGILGRAPRALSYAFPASIREQNEDSIALNYVCKQGHHWFCSWAKRAAINHSGACSNEATDPTFPYVFRYTSPKRQHEPARPQGEGERMLRADVRLHREGSQFAISTNADNERDFIDGASHAIGRLLSESLDMEQIAHWLPLVVDVACKLRGYKADVIEKRLIVAGAWLPSDAVAVVSENATPARPESSLVQA